MCVYIYNFALKIYVEGVDDYNFHYRKKLIKNSLHNRLKLTQLLPYDTPLLLFIIFIYNCPR